MDTENENVDAGESGEPEPTGPLGHAQQLRQDINDAVKRLHDSGEVRNRIVQALSEKVIAERTEKLAKAFGRREQMSRDLNKIRPDIVGYNANGAKVSEAFSKAKLDELKKAKEELNRLDKAIGKAVDDADFEPLQKFIGG